MKRIRLFIAVACTGISALALGCLTVVYLVMGNLELGLFTAILTAGAGFAGMSIVKSHEG